MCTRSETVAARTPFKRGLTAVALTAALATLSPDLLAQWPPSPPTGVPKTPDGKTDLNAPTPRTADGKPDFTGVWERAPCPTCATKGEINSGNVGLADIAPYQPWAADLAKKRRADNNKDNPQAHCLPMGIMQLTSHPFPRKIIQTPLELIVIYEGSGTTVRELFLDGRPLPAKDAEPWWNGYSTGHWEGETLVVETTGFMDDGWLDARGSPLTSEGKIIERFHRLSYGNLEIAVTIDDPKAYTKPFTVPVYYHIMPQTELIEFVCIDKDASHYVGGSAK